MGGEVEPGSGGVRRADIQALRAIAVLAVVVYHLWPERLPGGYIGVDVFFVVSGFLITGQLVRELEATGSLRVGAFWLRRARRLLPAATLVLVASAIGVVLLVPYGYWQQFLGESVAATLYVENWALAASSVDYLAADNGASLVQHYWSLSVEEQFYLLWPLALLGAMSAAATLRKDRRISIALGVALLTGLSLAWSIVQTVTDPGVAYFSTGTRAWEFGVGGLLAFVGPAQRLPSWLRDLTSVLGVAMIIASAVLFDRDTAFPGFAALLPVLGAALVIASATTGSPWASALGFAPVQAVGALSYSLYLWHWPPIAVALILADGRLTAPVKIAILIGALAAAWATYRFVEEPFRGRPTAHPRRAAAVIGIAMLCAVAVAGAPLVALSNATTQAHVAPPFASASALQSLIAQAGSMTGAPPLGPGAGPAPEWVHDDCLDVTEDSAARCVYGATDAPLVAVVVGDSISASWLPGLRRALDPEQWRIQVLTLGQCPVADVSIVRNDGNTLFTEECDDHRAWVRDWLAASPPDLVLASQSSSAAAYLASGAKDDAAVAEWAAGLHREFEHLASLTSTVVVLGRPEFGQRPAAECVGLLLAVEPCTGRFTEASEFADLERRAAETAGLAWVQTRGWICTPDDTCPAVVDGTPVTADGSHLTWDYSRRLSAVLAEALLAIDGISALPGVG